jgi:hypothetical protein
MRRMVRRRRKAVVKPGVKLCALREGVRNAAERGTKSKLFVPVEYKTRSKDSAVVTVTTHFFWFSDEVIRGVTRRMELCP